jgi:hypothetical protein
MLPVYVGHSAIFGCLFLWDPQNRLERSPSLALARAMLPLRVWGFIFLSIGCVMMFALVSHHRRDFTFALYLYAVTMFLWVGIYIGALFLNPDASSVAFAWPLGWAAACVASALSIEYKDV